MRKEKFIDNIKFLLLAIFSGIFIGISFPNFFLPFAFIIGFFFYFKSLFEDSYKRHLIFSFFIGFSSSLISLYWLYFATTDYINLTPTLSIVILIVIASVFSFYQFLSFSVVLLILKRFFKEKVLMLAPFVWVNLEMFREFFPFGGFPWNLMGYSISYINQFAQLTSILGIYGLSLLCIFLSVSVFVFFHKKTVISGSILLTGILITVLIYIYGEYRINNLELKSDKKVYIAIVQGNIGQALKLSKNKEPINDIYLSLLNSIDKDIDLIILPETAIYIDPYYIDETYLKFYKNLKVKAPILTGIDHLKVTEDSVEIYNGMFLLSPKLKVLDYYHKIKLVPFGEYTPKMFKFLGKVIEYLVSGLDFSAGKEKNIIHYKNMKIVPLICFESIFTYFTGTFSQRGNIIINITNDAWFGNTSAPYQHFEMARVRAIENGKYLIRVANTGISAVIKPNGEISSLIGLNKRKIEYDNVYLIEGKTFFCENIKYIYKFYILLPFLLIILLAFIDKIGEIPSLKG